MEKMSNMHEMVSALADGELRGGEFAHAVEAVCADEAARQSWHAYHLVGDVLRSSELASPSNGSDFVARLRARMAREPMAMDAVPASLAVQVHALSGAPRQPAANLSRFGWPVAAGVAALAAVGAISWNMLGFAGSRPAAVELARTAPATAPVMIRDARLDELLAAHRQAGGGTALQMPAGFLRNATFETSGR